MIIRREACEIIFYNKWQSFFDQSKSERKRALRHINSAIRDGLISHALLNYGVTNKMYLSKIKDEFIRDIEDSIVYHELGHHIAYSDTDPAHNAFSHNKFVKDGRTGHVLSEILADYAPEKDQQKGALARFIELAQTDIKRATGNFYVYMSDNWFLSEDDDDEYMKLMSDVEISLATYFIKPDGSVDFIRIKKEYEQIYIAMLKFNSGLINKLFDVIRKSRFEIGTRQLSYTELVKGILKEIRKKKHVNFNCPYLASKLNDEYKNNMKVLSLEELPKLETYSQFWAFIMICLEENSKSGWEEYNKVLSEEADLLEQMILNDIIKDKGKYNSLREYIVKRAKEIGIVKMLPKINYRTCVREVCASIKLTKHQSEKAQKKFREIMRGTNYDISINYEGKKDPFILVLQEILLKSNYGDIQSSMFEGEFYDPFETYCTREEYIKDTLETLRYQLESEMYLEIDILRVNEKYSISQVVEKLLTEVKLLNGMKIIEKINSIEYVEFENDVLFEVFIPLKKGYMDWNTTQAIWRINQDLRPDDFLRQWVVDWEFLEALFESY
jgi:hypothetical protein